MFFLNVKRCLTGVLFLHELPRFDVCVLQYEYDTNETGDRVVLGRGTYGVVYAGRDLSNQVRIAIKEIPERDSRYVHGQRHIQGLIHSVVIY